MLSWTRDCLNLRLGTPIYIVSLFAILILVAPAILFVQQIPFTSSNISKKPFEVSGPKDSFIPSYVIHDPIYITSNADFASEGFPGSGTSEDPFFIAGYSITATTEHCIYIQNTDAYFVIRDCLLKGEMSEDGIRFSGVVHGAIQNNTISGNFVGMSISSSSNNTIVDNTFSGNLYSGVRIGGSSNNTIENNTISGNYFGLHIMYSSNNAVVNNTISGNIVGVKFYISSNYTLSSNIFVNNGIRIYGNNLEDWKHTITSDNLVNGKPLGYFRNLNGGTIDGSHYGQIILVNCTGISIEGGVFNNATVGIEFGFSSYCNLRNNMASGNLIGIEFFSSSYNTIEDNTVFGSSYSGVHLIRSSYNTIENNIVSGNSYSGVHLISSSFTTVENNAISGSSYGVYDTISQNNTIMNNNIFGNIFGVDLYISKNITLSSNILVNNGIRIHGSGFSTPAEYWQHTITVDNLVNDKPLGYFWNWNGGTIDGSQYGQVILGNCTGVTIENGEFSNASVGIELGYSSYCTLRHNTLSKHEYGVELHSSSYSTIVDNNFYEISHSSVHLSRSSNNTLERNTISGNSYSGIHLYYSPDNTIVSNNIYGTDSGVHIDFSTNNLVVDNTIFGNSIGVNINHSSKNNIVENNIIYENGKGVHIEDSMNNTVVGNVIYRNEYGVYIDYQTYNNLIYLNTITDNVLGNARDYGVGNQWNTTLTGNFWSDYIGSGRYLIPGEAVSIDYYPLFYSLEIIEGAVIAILLVGIAVSACVLILKRYRSGSLNG